jgi:hypothetical protein
LERAIRAGVSQTNSNAAPHRVAQAFAYSLGKTVGNAITGCEDITGHCEELAIPRRRCFVTARCEHHLE